MVLMKVFRYLKSGCFVLYLNCHNGVVNNGFKEVSNGVQRRIPQRAYVRSQEGGKDRTDPVSLGSSDSGMREL